MIPKWFTYLYHPITRAIIVISEPEITTKVEGEQVVFIIRRRVYQDRKTKMEIGGKQGDISPNTPVGTQAD